MDVRNDADVTFVSNGGFQRTGEDVKRFDIGLGWAMPLNLQMFQQSDFVASAAYSDIDYGDFDFGASGDSSLGDLDDDSSDGYFIDARLRAQLVEWAEASAGARYTDLEDAEDLSLIGNVLFEINQNLGINLEVNAGDDLSEYCVGVRYSMDNQF